MGALALAGVIVPFLGLSGVQEMRSPTLSVSICLQLDCPFGRVCCPFHCVAHLGDLCVELFLLQREAEKLPGLLDSCSHLINVPLMPAVAERRMLFVPLHK